MFCPKCAFASPASVSFCPQCGRSLDSDRPVPEAGAEYSSRAEWRRLSVVVCEMVGASGDLSGHLDPGELQDLMSTASTFPPIEHTLSARDEQALMKTRRRPRRGVRQDARQRDRECA